MQRYRHDTESPLDKETQKILLNPGKLFHFSFIFFHFTIFSKKKQNKKQKNKNFNYMKQQQCLQVVNL